MLNLRNKRNYTLFTTTRCVKCPAVKEYLAGIDVEVEILDENTKGFRKRADVLDIDMVPMFLMFEHGVEMARVSEVSEIKDLLKL